MPSSFTSSEAHSRKSSMASIALNPTLKGKKKKRQLAESESAATGSSSAKVMVARVYEDALCIVHQLLKSQYKNIGDGELTSEDSDDDEEEEEEGGDSGEDNNDDDIFHPSDDNEPNKKRKMLTRTPPILTFLPSTTETTGQPDKQSWVKTMQKPRPTTLIPPPVAATAPATTSSVLSSRSYTQSPQPFLPSRQLTKSQLTSIVWHVRELSRRLGFIRIKMHVHSIFLLTKMHDSTLTERTRELVSWLLSPERGARYVVYVESALLRSHHFDVKGLRSELATRYLDAGDENAAVEIEDPEHGRIRVWTTELCREKAETFDFCITLGGDGTVLYAGWLFQQVVPPVLTFSLGSLGFLTKYNFDHYQETLTGAFREGVVVSLRLRFECTVMRSNARPRTETKTKSPEGNTEISISPASSSTEHFANQQEDPIHNKNNDRNKKMGDDDDSELPSPTPPPPQNDLIEELIGPLRHSPTHTPTFTFSILNELVLDRGPSASLTTLEIFGDTRHFTTVLADGLVVSTPTGSTAYNLAAGGSLCHPENPVMLVTAICAHALSFRPIILPDTIVLRVGVPYDARTGSWAVFDGRERVELGPGDYVTVSASRYPFASVVGEGGSGAGDWVNNIRQKLGWNMRQKQKAFMD